MNLTKALHEHLHEGHYKRNIVMLYKESDEHLISLAIDGDKKALESLIKRYQDWIYNLALKFVGDRDEALDLTQEVLIKMVTKLSLFKHESQFSTWLYRIMKNHFLNVERGKYERTTTSFENYGKGLDAFPDERLNHYAYEVEEKLLVNEAKISCMNGMLLCLDREQRLIFLLGELFEFPDTVGAEIMELSRENFRVKLHRAKKQLYTFMDNKCGLVNKKNPCRCARKTAAFIKAGCVHPQTLLFQAHVISKTSQMIDKKIDTYSNEIESDYQKLYQEHPFLESPDALESIRQLLATSTVRETFNLG